jgi:hypothetical protein
MGRLELLVQIGIISLGTLCAVLGIWLILAF